MIEDAIAKLTAAIEANTAVLNQILASSGNTSAAEPVETPKPAKAPKEKKSADLKVVEPEAPVETTKTEEPVETTESETAAASPKHTLKEAVEASMAFLGKDRDANKPKLAELREKFGIKTVKDLAEDQIDAYMAELAKL
jgi:hypothetical protein